MVEIVMNTSGRNTNYVIKGTYVNHREDGPAVIREADPGVKNGYQQWFHFGQLHRVDGPAFEYPETAHKEYFIYGQRHRVDGPARTSATCEEWYIGGMLHNITGPAIAYPGSETKIYCLFGSEVSKDLWSKMVKDPDVIAGHNALVERYKDLFAPKETTTSAAPLIFALAGLAGVGMMAAKGMSKKQAVPVIKSQQAPAPVAV